MATNAQELHSQNKLSTNNSAVSDSSDRLISLLEWGEGNIRSRILINKQLETLLNPEQIIWLNKRKTIKDKIAYIVSVSGLSFGELEKEINNWIEALEHDILNSSDFSESFIIRNAALNRFECKLSSNEVFELRKTMNVIKRFCDEKWLTDLSNALGYHDETHAQSLMKMKEIVEILQKKWVEMVWLENNPKYQNLISKLNLLDKLDDSYKTMMLSLNQVHEIARHNFSWIFGINSALSLSETNKLKVSLGGVSPKKIIDWYFKQLEVNKDKENEHNYLQEYLNDNFSSVDPAVLKANKLSQAEFEKYFLIYFAKEILEESKLRFDKNKLKAFWHRSKLFDQDINIWRGIARDRVIELWNSPISNERNAMLDSYFEKFQSLFYGDRDSVWFMGSFYRWITDQITWYSSPNEANQMRETLNSILERRYANIWGNLPWINVIWRTADLIMNQNWTLNQMFYNDKNPFVEEEWFGQRIMKVIWRTEEYRKDIMEVVWPIANKALTFSEEIIKWALKITAWSGKTISKAISTPTWAFNAFIEKKAEWWFIKKNLIRLAKVSGVLWPITKSLELATKWTHSLIEWTENVAKKSYEGAINVIRKTAWDNEIKYMYQWFSHLLDWIAGLAWRSISWISNFAYDKLNTSQKREVLAKLYEAAGSEEELRRWVETADLWNAIDLRSHGIYLFDKDGRIDNIYDSDEQDLIWEKLDITGNKPQKPEPQKPVEKNPENNIEEPQKPEEIAVVSEEEKAKAELQDIENRKLKLREFNSSHESKSLKKINKLNPLSISISINKIQEWTKIVLYKNQKDNLVIVIKKLPENNNWIFVVDFLYNEPGKSEKIELNQTMKIEKDRVVFPKREKADLKLSEYKPNKYLVSNLI